MCQERCVVGDPKANLQTMSEAITRHGGGGGGGGGACDAVVFAEMFLQGYGTGYDVAALAEAQNGPSFVAISKMASTANLHVIYSYAEKAPDDDRLYISIQCVDPTCASIANVRKTHLYTPSAFESQNFTPGDAALSPVFLLCGVATALLICFDVECVETPRALARRGAELLLVVGANDSVFVMNAMLATRAMENLCHVMYVNQMEKTFCGFSGAYGPDGMCIAQLGGNGVTGCVTVAISPNEEKYITFRAQNPYWGVVVPRKKSFFQIPQRVHPGDAVAIVAPSSGLAHLFPWVLDLALKRMAEPPFSLQPVVFPTARMSSEALEADPRCRAADINAAFADPAIRAVICTIGGNDQIRVLPFLNAAVIAANPKPFLGFSDCTNIHLFLWNLGMCSFYGGSAMCQFAATGPHIHPYTESSLMRSLFGTGGAGDFPVSKEWTDVDIEWGNGAENLVATAPPMHQGEGWVWHGILATTPTIVSGTLWGGCMEILTLHIMARNYLPTVSSLYGCVLFFETSEELTAAGEVYRFLAGLGEYGALGGFSAILVGIPKAASRGCEVIGGRNAFLVAQRAAVCKALRDYGASPVVVFHMNFGHTHPQWALPMGSNVNINTVTKTISFG